MASRARRKRREILRRDRDRMGGVACPPRDVASELRRSLGCIGSVGHHKQVDVAVFVSIATGRRPVDTDKPRRLRPLSNVALGALEDLTPERSQQFDRRR